MDIFKFVRVFREFRGQMFFPGSIVRIQIRHRCINKALALNQLQLRNVLGVVVPDTFTMECSD